MFALFILSCTCVFFSSFTLSFSLFIFHFSFISSSFSNPNAIDSRAKNQLKETELLISISEDIIFLKKNENLVLVIICPCKTQTSILNVYMHGVCYFAAKIISRTECYWFTLFLHWTTPPVYVCDPAKFYHTFPSHRASNLIGNVSIIFLSTAVQYRLYECKEETVKWRTKWKKEYGNKWLLYWCEFWHFQEIYLKFGGAFSSLPSSATTHHWICIKSVSFLLHIHLIHFIQLFSIFAALVMFASKPRPSHLLGSPRIYGHSRSFCLPFTPNAFILKINWKMKIEDFRWAEAFAILYFDYYQAWNACSWQCRLSVFLSSLHLPMLTRSLARSLIRSLAYVCV